MQTGCEGRGKGENITETLVGGKGRWRREKKCQKRLRSVSVQVAAS